MPEKLSIEGIKKHINRAEIMAKFRDMSLREAKYASGDFQLVCALLPLHALTNSQLCVCVCTVYRRRVILNIH